MKKYFLLVVLLFTLTNFWSQRNQLIAFIDMEYILENVPEYLQAQNTLDAKVAKWRKKLDDQARHIEVLTKLSEILIYSVLSFETGNIGE